MCVELGKTLRELRLSDCPAITDASLIAVSAVCPLLRALEVDRVEKITDEGVTAVAEGCKELSTFAARRCTGLEVRRRGKKERKEKARLGTLELPIAWERLRIARAGRSVAFGCLVEGLRWGAVPCVTHLLCVHGRVPSRSRGRRSSCWRRTRARRSGASSCLHTRGSATKPS